MACYDWALQYAQQRVQFGRPIAGFQLVQQKLVWMLAEITKAQLLCLQLGRLKDAGALRAQQVSLAKMNNVQMALDAGTERQAIPDVPVARFRAIALCRLPLQLPLIGWALRLATGP